MKGAGDEEDDVVDHVAVRHVVQELRQRLHRLVPHVLQKENGWINIPFLKHQIFENREEASPCAAKKNGSMIDRWRVSLNLS